MPEKIVVPAQEQKFIFPAVETRDARARLEKRRIAPIGGGQKKRLYARLLLEPLEQLIATLLRPTTHQLGMVKTDEQNPSAAGP